MWAASPPYLVVEPGLPADVPPSGAHDHELAARDDLQEVEPARARRDHRTYRDTYRGTGPEQVPSLNTGAGAKDLPVPVLPDPTA